MRTFILLLFISIFSSNTSAQKPDIALAVNDFVYTSPVEVMPEYKGGMQKLYERLQNIRYLFLDRMQNIQGKVFVSLIIEKDGSVTSVKMLRGLTAEQDIEVLRVIRNLRKWKPGMHNGKPVRVQFCIPIDFKLVNS